MNSKAVTAPSRAEKGKKTSTVVTDAEAQDMHYADNSGIKSRLLQSPEKISVFVRMAGLFGLMVSEPRMEIMRILSKGIQECPLTINAGGRTYKTNGSVRLPWTYHQRVREGERRSRAISAEDEVLSPE